jgi:hypothetical protein
MMEGLSIENRFHHHESSLFSAAPLDLARVHLD